MGEMNFSVRTDEAKEVSPGMQVFYDLRAEAEKNGIQDMTLDEINDEIQKTREGVTITPF